MPEVMRDFANWLNSFCSVCNDFVEPNSAHCIKCGCCIWHCKCTDEEMDQAFQEKYRIDNDHWDIIENEE